MVVNHTRIVSNTAQGNGGGIYNVCKLGATDSTTILTITHSTVAGNVADGSLRGYFAGNGGGLASSINLQSEGSTVALTIVDSTVSGNTAGGTGAYWMGNGGGLFLVTGQTSIVNTTVSGNRAEGIGPAGGAGGGVWASAGLTVGNLELLNVTITGNSAAVAGGGAHFLSGPCWCQDTPDPVAICGEMPMPPTGPTIVIQNTLLSANRAPLAEGCCFCEATLLSQGYNLEDGDSCQFHQAGDLTRTDPLLGPLQDDGGPTWTHLPLAGSPAVDAGRCPGFALDQRGFPRPVDHPNIPNAADGCDIGAVELGID